ncbi:MAG TPA: zf-HC2 domain-containing protein [Blastocatellia bacterium]|nr:zf-HC2 domain-containing protein [Blastocatellia bacterium]
MNVINFEQHNCKKVQSYLDSYLNNELLVETTHEISKHLENCANCHEALLVRQRVKELLKGAVLKDAAPIDLQEKVRRSIRKNSPPNRARWMLVAAAMIALTVAGIGALQLFNRGTPTGSDAISAASNANAQLLKIGLDDHVHCAIDMGLANRVFTEEEMLKQLGPDFSGLVATVKENAPENYKVVVGHRCRFKGREFIHLILKSPETALSLVLTKKNGESFSEDTVTAVIGSSGIPIHEALVKDLQIAGFETQDYLAFVVSDLGRKESLQMAFTLVPAVREFLTRQGA